jgi:hypothetical protein
MFCFEVLSFHLAAQRGATAQKLAPQVFARKRTKRTHTFALTKVTVMII